MEAVIDFLGGVHFFPEEKIVVVVFMVVEKRGEPLLFLLVRLRQHLDQGLVDDHGDLRPLRVPRELELLQPSPYPFSDLRVDRLVDVPETVLVAPKLDGELPGEHVLDEGLARFRDSENIQHQLVDKQHHRIDVVEYDLLDRVLLGSVDTIQDVDPAIRYSHKRFKLGRADLCRLGFLVRFLGRLLQASSVFLEHFFEREEILFVVISTYKNAPVGLPGSEIPQEMPKFIDPPVVVSLFRNSLSDWALDSSRFFFFGIKYNLILFFFF